MPEDGKDPKNSDPHPSVQVESSSEPSSDYEEIEHDAGAAEKNNSDEKKKPEMALLESVLGTSSDDILKQNPASANYLSRDAVRFAERAKKNLEMSTKKVKSNGVHVPTWTGKSGAAGLRNVGNVQAQKKILSAEEVKIKIRGFLEKNRNAPFPRVYSTFSGMVREAGVKNFNMFLKDFAELRGSRWVVKY